MVNPSTSQWVSTGEACEFTWSATVPTVAEYQVTVAGAATPVDYTLAQMQQANWKIGISFNVSDG